jgi:cell division protein FtsB
LWLQTLNWRRDSGVELRMKRLANEIEQSKERTKQIERETEQLRQENKRLAELNDKIAALWPSSNSNSMPTPQPGADSST